MAVKTFAEEEEQCDCCPGECDCKDCEACSEAVPLVGGRDPGAPAKPAAKASPKRGKSH